MDRLFRLCGPIETPQERSHETKVRRSTDGGITWLVPQVLVRNDPLLPLRLPSVAAHDDQAYVTMTRFVSSRLQYFMMVSSNGGETWDSVRQITFVPESHGLGNIFVTAISVHLVFERAVQPSGKEIAYMVSTNKGITWSDEQVLSTVDTYQAWNPNVAADGAGNVYISWQDAKYGSIGGFAGIVLLRRSTDNGQSWLSEIRITPVPAANGSSVALSGSYVHVGFGDERDGFQDATARYKISTDGGGTWCDEIVLGGPLRRALSPSVGSTPDRVYASGPQTDPRQATPPTSSCVSERSSRVLLRTIRCTLKPSQFHCPIRIPSICTPIFAIGCTNEDMYGFLSLIFSAGV